MHSQRVKYTSNHTKRKPISITQHHTRQAASSERPEPVGICVASAIHIAAPRFCVLHKNVPAPATMKFLPKKMLPTSRQQRPPPAESESALDRTNHVSLHSRRSRIRAYSKHDYPAAANDDPLGDTGHGTQSSSASSIPSEITIKLDDLHGHGAFAGGAGGSSSPWVLRKAPPPAVDNCPHGPRGTRIEGIEDEDVDEEDQGTHPPENKHDDDTANNERPNQGHNDGAAAVAENTRRSSAQNSSSASVERPDGVSSLFGQITMGWNAHSCQLFVESNSTRSKSATFIYTPVSVIIVRWHNVHVVFGLLHWPRTSWRHWYFLVRGHDFAFMYGCMAVYCLCPLFFVRKKNWY